MAKSPKRKNQVKPFNLEKSWADKRRKVDVRPLGTQVIDNKGDKRNYDRNKAKRDLRRESDG